MYDEPSDICYWSSIEEQRYSLLQKYVETVKSDSIYLTMKKGNILQKGRDKNKEFIDKIREDYISILKWHGIAIAKGEGYVKEMPGPPRSEIELRRSKLHLRMNLSSLITYYMLVNDLEMANVYCDFLMKIDKSHFNHFYYYGLINLILGNRDKAMLGYEGALAICERDKKWPKDSMEQIKNQIKIELEQAKSV